MDVREMREMIETLQRLAIIATTDPAAAQQVRDILAESGLLAVYGAGDDLDVVELLDAGGEGALRARLAELTVAQLRKIITARQFDPDKQAARWRSASKLIDLIVTRAQEQLATEQEAAVSHPNATAAAWML